MSYPPEPEDLPRQWNDTPVRHCFPFFKYTMCCEHFAGSFSVCEALPPLLPAELTSPRDHLLKSSDCDTDLKRSVARWVTFLCTAVLYCRGSLVNFVYLFIFDLADFSLLYKLNVVFHL